MAKMVGSAVVQEVVSGAIKFVRSNHEELASQDHLMERLKMAKLGLKLSLERSKNMPITDVALLQTRMELRLAFQKCRDVLNKHTVLRVQPLSPSLTRRIIRALKPFFSTEKDCISRPCVRKFEWFAEMADKFLRDVESGCSLARYRFSSPLFTQLLEGKKVYYRMVRGSQTRTLSIYPTFLEDYGVVAWIGFKLEDVETPMKCCELYLMLRLSESTDIVGMSIKCLQSLEPQFNHVADVVSGELAQISIQVAFFTPEPAMQELYFNLTAKCSRSYRQEPLCCIGDAFQPSANNTLSSELAERFPEAVTVFMFECFISAAGYNWPSSTVEANRNNCNAWPILRLKVGFLPHFSVKSEDDKFGTYAMTSGGEILGPLGLDLQKVAKILPFVAVHWFKLEPERTQYTMNWYSAHGVAVFIVSKATTEMGCAPKIGDGSKIRRVSKRKR